MQPNSNEPIIADSDLKLPEEAMRITHTGSDAHLPVILGVIIVLLVLLLGGLYLWGSTLNAVPEQPMDQNTRPTAEQNNEPESDTADAQVQALETVSTSNELNAIDADVESTNLDQLDAELNTIDTELDASATATTP